MRVARSQRLVVATALTVLVGAGVSLQSYVNGRLGQTLGAAELAAVVNTAVGLGLTIAVVLATRAAPRAWRARRGVRWWHLTGGTFGAAFVASGAFIAPELGVSLFIVGIVCGQATGSLAVDRTGLGPAGRQRISHARIVGVGLAVAAVSVSALGQHTGDHPWLVLFALLTGVGAALQQACNGHLARIIGDPVVTAGMNFSVSLLVLTPIAIATTGLAAPNGWSAPPLELIGGVFGLLVLTLTAITVRHVGVLRVILALTAGQVAGALFIDLIAPAAGQSVKLGTLAGVALAFAAVAVAQRPSPDHKG